MIDIIEDVAIESLRRSHDNLIRILSGSRRRGERRRFGVLRILIGIADIRHWCKVVDIADRIGIRWSGVAVLPIATGTDSGFAATQRAREGLVLCV
jgi:hypothetical protein